MRDVTLVELHTTGEHLVLVDASGDRYLLPIDDTLKAAVRHDKALLNRLQGGKTEQLTPREIQARLRAGMSAEEMVRVGGLSAEHVDRYAGPVLAEREHMAERARKVAVARTAKGDIALGEAVAERLKARDAAEHTAWDSWREEAGSWIVQVLFEAGGRKRTAEWRYHPADATIEPIDDEGRWLTGLPEPDAATPTVTDRVFDVEADGRVREHVAGNPHLRSDASGARTLEDDAQTRTLDLLDALRGRRGRRQPTDDEGDSQPDLVDALLEAGVDPEELDELSGPNRERSATERAESQRSSRVSEQNPPPAHPPASRPEEARDAEILTLPEPAAGPQQASPPEADDTDEAAKPTRRRVRQAKRATVPSWDDIMFGAKKD